MGKKYLTVRKRRKGERKVAENNRISNKHIRCPSIFHKSGDEQQSNYSYTDSQQCIRSSKPCDENSKQCDDKNNEQLDDENSEQCDENNEQWDDENSEQCDENNEQLDDENNEQWDDENNEQCDENLASSELPGCLSLCGS